MAPRRRAVLPQRLAPLRHLRRVPRDERVPPLAPGRARAPVGAHRKLAEIERAVITLANRVRKLRQEFDTLVAAINAR